ncbi:MAG: hypothetical protein EZS28_016045 [Streblomastix strix]|uniref:Uncharacterized protein n=1 Tax=Streblomastix strix TaxID=222440 RepID=A0A5J4W1M4_9EUKA|nr:MAG: hypothetical protein EZS28_016045 [Streblomastix strix]
MLDGSVDEPVAFLYSQMSELLAENAKQLQIAKKKLQESIPPEKYALSQNELLRAQSLNAMLEEQLTQTVQQSTQAISDLRLQNEAHERNGEKQTMESEIRRLREKLAMKEREDDQSKQNLLQKDRLIASLRNTVDSLHTQIDQMQKVYEKKFAEQKLLFDQEIFILQKTQSFT